ncbi:MAG: DNA recombination protein RmuC [Clostridia bacterium]|nr:DNA recombination protein RmuC [Clostridia bacterium]
MENKLLIIVLITCLVSVIINAAMLFLISKQKKEQDYSSILEKQNEFEKRITALLDRHSKFISEEFSRSRIENSQAQSSQRREISASLSEMSQQIEKSAKENYDFNMKAISAISKSLSEIRVSNEQHLEQIRNTVDEKLSDTLSKRLDSSFQAVSVQLENVYKSLGEMKILSGGVTENVTALNRILTNVKSRGTWAEIQLEAILDQTIPEMYVKNAMPDPLSKQIVEFAVKIPSSDEKDKFTLLPIDSKFPIEDYLRLCAAADEGDNLGVDSARKALETRVIQQAKDVSKYIKEPITTPFAILYLATEGLYSEIISSKNGVVERCQREFGIMIAGPSTITALLNSLSVGFKAMAINEKAKEVRILLAAAKSQYEKFGAMLEKAKKKIEEAGKSLDDAQSRNEIIQKKLKGVEDLSEGKAIEILGLSDSNLSD